MRIVLPAALPGLGLALASLLAAAALGAAPEAPASTAPASASPAALPLPSQPAFSTRAVSRIRSIDGDAFTFECDDRRVITIRLADADCRALGSAAVESAKSIATNLLQTGTVWVFPCGQTKGAAGDEVWADVWTAKGWLSDVLIRAGYASRRPDAGAAALTAVEKPCASTEGAPPPPAPAFAAAACTSSEGDALEVEHKGRKIKVTLADVTCQGLDSAKRDAAAATTTRLLQAGPFWVFPCQAMKGQDPNTIRGRVWTQRGWLSNALLQEGSARRMEESERHAATPAAGPATSAAKTGPAVSSPRTAPKTPAAPSGEQTKWREIPLTPSGATAMSCQSTRFKIEVPQWRVSWNLTPWRTGSPTSITVCRVEENVATGGVSKHVGSFTGLSGNATVRAQPGTFWIQITGSGKLDVKVEVPE